MCILDKYTQVYIVCHMEGDPINGYIRLKNHIFSRRMILHLFGIELEGLKLAKLTTLPHAGDNLG
jgi:hypothetical protein